ncbi:ribonuclease H-like domain-containing protein [Tanacetum coccineum]
MRVKTTNTRNQDNSRRTINVEEISSKAMLAIDGAGIDWSFMADEEVPSDMRSVQQPDFERYGPKAYRVISEEVSNENLLNNKKKPVRKPVKYVEMYRSQGPRGNQRNWNNQKSQQLGSGTLGDITINLYFLCGSFDHLQTNCNYHQMERVVSGSNYTRVNYNYSAQKAHPSAQRNMVPRAVLMKNGLRTLNTARPVNTAHPKTTVYSARPMSRFSKSAQSTVKRPFYTRTTLTNKNLSQKVNTAKGNFYTAKLKAVNTARPIAQHMYSLPAYAFIAQDFTTQAALYTHHQYIAGFIMTGAFAHGAIFFIRDYNPEQNKDNVLARILEHKEAIISHLRRSSNSPERINLKPLIVSAKPTYFPREPANTSATKKGCDRKRSTAVVNAVMENQVNVVKASFLQKKKEVEAYKPNTQSLTGKFTLKTQECSWKDYIEFNSTEPIEDNERELWVELKRLFEPVDDDELRKSQRYMHDPLTWRLYDTFGVHHVFTEREHDIFMLVETRIIPLKRRVRRLMSVYKLASWINIQRWPDEAF